MNITFIGDPKPNSTNPPFVTIGGVRFELDVPVQVTDEKLIERLAGNSHFSTENLDGLLDTKQDTSEEKHSDAPVPVPGKPVAAQPNKAPNTVKKVRRVTRIK